MATMQGDLGEYALPDLLQFIHATRKQGQLVLERGAAASAGVYFAQGEVVHAYCPPRVGVPAFHQILTWEEGRFAFLKNAAPAQRTIHDDLQNLLLDGLRRLDEVRALSERLPARETVLHLAPPEAQRAEIRLTRSEWTLLSLVNGRRTLAEVLRQAEGGEAEVLRTVYGLLVSGLVTPVRDDAWLDAIVPARIPAREASPSRSAPPTILANLVLKRVDGHRSLATILAELACGERALADEIHLLERTGWIRFAAGADLYARHLAG